MDGEASRCLSLKRFCFFSGILHFVFVSDVVGRVMMTMMNVSGRNLNINKKQHCCNMYE